MNEVSNGPTGNMEYVEFVVVDSNVVYNCSGITNPPCIDIRGWIFDDNSGYHGASGVATGCIRFSNNAFWSCIPLGTMILIYNNLDPNSSLPPDDISMSDGNCRIVAPVNNATLFESNGTTPGAVACSYPAAGWTASGNWNNTLLANPGDCARIVNLSGCEVFSVCWGTANLFNLIYFAGSAQDRVYSFVNTLDNNPSNNANWNNGCADLVACGSNVQTPGAPNNAANAAWINSFNNGCLPIPPIAAIGSSTNGGCSPCAASASVSASGSIPPYTYTWSPVPGSGQGTANAGGLCTGSYSCYVESSIGCLDTIVVNVSSGVAFTGTITPTPVTCNGLTNGSATVAVTGVTTPYSYTWSPAPGGGQGTASVTGLSSQIYTVSISDIGGCLITVTSTITQPAILTSILTTGNILCNNGITNATATVGGGTGGYSYTWSPTGGNSSIATNLTAGSYTVLVKDANNCTITAVTNIIQPTALTAPVSSSSVLCNGGNTGNSTVTASGGTPGYTYTWNPSGGNFSTATNLTAGSYTVLLKDANNCTVTAVTNIAQPAALTAPVSSSSILCNGGLTGSAIVTAGGGTPGYSYTWSPSGGNSATASNLSAGNYTVLVKDVNNCTISAVTNITQPAALVAPISSSSVLCNGGSTGSTTVTAVGGTPGYTYTWSPVGGNSVTSSSLTVGTYTILVKDANNCTVTAVTNITQPSALTAPLTTSNVLCNGGSTGSATVTAGGGIPGYTYTWSPSGGNSSAATNLSAGSYTVLVTDANNCITAAVANVSQPAAISATVNSTNASCGQSNGSATVNVSGGISGYNYNWSPSGGTSSVASGLAAGTYTVLITDANNCVFSTIANINQPSVITTSISATNVTCFGGANGTSTVLASGGAGPYTYTWTPGPGGGQGTNIITGLTSQTYSVIITDALGCFTTTAINITQPAVLNAAVSSTNISCNGLSNGSASVIANGGTGVYSYTWAPSGGNAFSTSGLSAGNYTVTVADANNCQITASANILEPSPITASITSSNITCNGFANGSTSVTAAGGTPGYTYTWSPSGGNTAIANNLSALTYSVVIRDLNNCINTATINIIQPSPLTVIGTQTNVTCNGGTNGQAAVLSNGGTSPYSYSWLLTGITAPLTTSLTSGTYTCVITDFNNCAITQTFSITQPALLIASTSNYSICSGNSATVTSSASGGVAPYNFNWNGGAFIGQTINPVPVSNTTYSLVVTDNNGCTSSPVTSSVTVFSQPTVSIAGNDSICSGNSTIINASVVGAAGNVTYFWTPGSFTTSAITVTPSSNTIYNVIVTTSGLCPSGSTKQVTVTVLPNPIVSVNSPPSGCAPLCVKYTSSSSVATGTIIGWSWNFNNGSSSIVQNPTICFAAPGTYTGQHTVVNSFGCMTTINTGSITVYPKPVADFNHSPIKPIVNIDQEVIFTDASWGTPIVSWNWYFMNTAQYTSTQQNPTFAYTEAGNYVVALIVKSDLGCTDTLLRPIVVGEDYGLYVPNAFTPNEDGFNDVFQPKGFGIVKYELNIFDRWGEKLFHTTTFEEAWNGTYQGRSDKLCKDDVYIWLINATDVFGKAHELTGHVTLLK